MSKNSFVFSYSMARWREFEAKTSIIEERNKKELEEIMKLPPSEDTTWKLNQTKLSHQAEIDWLTKEYEL